MGQGKRGKGLEQKIVWTNGIYKKKGWALVHKEPTPWNVSYDKRTGRVYRAFPQEKGTVDFIGVSKGKPIAFDAKSTKEETRFPLNNVKEHQVEYLKHHQEQGGISFLIVEFETLGEIYLLEFDQLYEWWVNSYRGGRKSIPYSYFKDECKRIYAKRGVAVDYLKVLEG